MMRTLCIIAVFVTITITLLLLFNDTEPVYFWNAKTLFEFSKKNKTAYIKI